MNIFCIIPAYNEEKTITKVIEDVKPFADKIVIVDDCSSDKTFELAKAQNVIVLKHVINRGQGAALQTGNEYALNNGADVVVHFDADGQFLAEEIKDITKPILDGETDVVFGSRFLEKKSDIPKLKKYIIFPAARLINKIFLGVKLTDPQSGFRAMNRKTAESIKIEQDGMAHCSEILNKSFKNKLRIKEVPITVIYNDFGQKFGGGVKILKDLLLGKFLN